MKKKEFNVKGMHCSSCEMLVKDSLEELDNVKKVEASAKDGKVTVYYEDEVDDSKIKKIIKEEGYEIG